MHIVHTSTPKHRRGHYDAPQETRDMHRLTADPVAFERGYLITRGMHKADES